MVPNPDRLLKIARIEIPLIGFYDVPDSAPFEPLIKAKGCYFSCYENWMAGESTLLSKDILSCRGSGYWVCGVEFTSKENFAKTLNEREGFKSTDKLMTQWLENQKPYQMEHPYVVIGPLKDQPYDCDKKYRKAHVGYDIRKSVHPAHLVDGVPFSGRDWAWSSDLRGPDFVRRRFPQGSGETVSSE